MAVDKSPGIKNLFCFFKPLSRLIRSPQKIRLHCEHSENELNRENELGELLSLLLSLLSLKCSQSNGRSLIHNVKT